MNKRRDEDIDRIDHIRELMEKGYKHPKRQSSIINNFYSLITIGVVCIAILLYSNYLRPILDETIAKEKHQTYLNQRAKEIALSHKLNNKEYNSSKDLTMD